MRLGIPQSLENKGKLGQLVDKLEFNELTVLLHLGAESLGVRVILLNFSVLHHCLAIFVEAVSFTSLK